MTRSGRTIDGRLDPLVERDAGPVPVGTVARAFHLLELLASEGPLRFTELKRKTSLPKGTLHRLLNALAGERVVRFDERTASWAAEHRILEMASRVWVGSDIRRASCDQLVALNALTGETVEVSVLAGVHALVIDYVESRQSVRHSSGVGRRSELCRSGPGKVLLAGCDERQRQDILERTFFARRTPGTIAAHTKLEIELVAISERGYATTLGERPSGTCCIAAPVLDALGRAIASISITAPLFRAGPKALASWRAPLVAATAEVGHRLAVLRLGAGGLVPKRVRHATALPSEP